MSEKNSSSSSAESPGENGEAAGSGKEETIPESEVPTLPDVSQPDTEVERSDSEICPTCGAEIPPEAPGGLCPKCALAGAAVPTDVDSLGGRSRSGPRFEAPEIETIAAAFPQLEIVELIGCGGMGAVYKARQPHLDRFVALKILPPTLAEIPGFTERFTREGRLLARLSHPAIVGVHDFGQAGGFFFLMMEYVDGVNLRQAMRAGRFTPEQALEIVPKVCEALQFAHDEGILHRDIKPENILLDSKGAVKIADFGIAKLLDEAAGADPTLTGSMAPGTPHYMAPEQIEQPGAVDHRADIYSLGVVFYEMLTGELPIGRFAAPSEKAAVDSQIDEIVFRSLEKERDRRQQSAGEVKTEIEGVPATAIAAERHPGYAIPAAGAGVTPPVDRPSGGRKAAVIVLAAFLLPLVMNVIFFSILRVQQKQHAHQMVQAEVARTEAARDFHQAKAKASQLEEELAQIADANRRAAKQRQLELMRLDIDRHAAGMENIRTYAAHVEVSRAWLWAPFGSQTLLVLLILALGIPGTLMGWKSLRRIRALELPEGRIAPLFAALFFPILLAGFLIFLLVALPLSFGPPWVGAVGVSLSTILTVVAGFFMVRAVLRWLNSAPKEFERNSVLADFEKPRNPWVGRLIWMILVLIGLPLVLIGIYIFAARGGTPGGAMPGVIELLVIAAIVGCFGFLLRLLTRGSRSRSMPSAGEEAAPVQPVNPWPRRVFWLIVLVFIVPVFFIFVALLVPWMFSRADPPPKTHTVQIIGVVENEHSVTVNLETRRFGKENVNVAVIYEGPASDSQENDHERIYPGQGQEWNLFGDDRRRTDTITFALPNREITSIVNREIERVFLNKGPRSDVRRIELFNVMSGESGSWRAWIEMRAGTVVAADSPPIEELLTGDWKMDAQSEGEAELAEIVLSFSADRRWSARASLKGAVSTSAGNWKLRGSGRLELVTDSSTTETDIGKSEHVSIESIDEDVLVIRGQVEDDPEGLTTYSRIFLPPELIQDHP